MPEPIYAVGDVHGQIDELLRVIDLIDKDGGPGAHTVFLGDYVDRGPDSKAVVQALLDGTLGGRNWICLKGNHDRYLERFVQDMTIYDSRTSAGLAWLQPRLGGDKTLQSYGVKLDDDVSLDAVHQQARQQVPQAHIAFLSGLPLYHETDNLILVHAGIRPGIPMERQEEDDLLWIRDGFLDFDGAFAKLVVHGHTALHYPEHAGNRVNLDGGAGYFRPLNAAVFEGTACWLLTDAGRVPLTP
jgi:serine/threonine protein phosphatase 1